MSVVLYHNPKCSTSRNALALLRERGIEPTVVEYLKTGWDKATLERLASNTGLGLRGLLRAKEAAAKALLEANASDADILKAVLAEPALIERPIIETDKGARIGRPVNGCSRFSNAGWGVGRAARRAGGFRAASGSTGWCRPDRRTARPRRCCDGVAIRP